MQILTSCHWKREGNQNNGGKILSEATLQSWHPNPTPPLQGWAGVCLSLLGSRHPSLPRQAQARHKPGTSQLPGLHSSQSHAASKRMVSGKEEELGAPVWDARHTEVFARARGKARSQRNDCIRRTDPILCYKDLYHSWGKGTNTQNTRSSWWAPRGL